MPIHSYLPRLPRPELSLMLFSNSRKRPHLSPPVTPVTETKTAFQISPFDLLPVELQVEIFTHCIPPFPQFDVNEAPLLIARVCRAWRSLVFSTPKLWSTFEIEVTGSGTSMSLHDLYIMSTMKLWLQRSKNYPLNVRVIHVPVGRVPDPRSAQLLAMLIPEARRWRHVQFIIPAANMAALRRQLPNDFPMLQSLTLQMKGIWNSEPGLDIMSMNIPWHQLTELDLQLEHNKLLTLDECLSVLSLTQNLRRCTMSADCVLDRANVRQDNLPLLSLEELHLVLQGGNPAQQMSSTDGASANLVTFLNLLDIPNLHTLQFGWLVQVHPDGPRIWSRSHSGFKTFLHNISPTLQSLSLFYLPILEDDLVECLTQVPEVRHLDLRFALNDRGHDPVTDSLLSSLSIHPTETSETDPDAQRGESLLPVLESFNLQCHGEAFSNTGLLAMIQSRWQASSVNAGRSEHSTFGRFRLLSMKPVLSEVEKRLTAWVHEGLDISIDSLVVR